MLELDLFELMACFLRGISQAYMMAFPVTILSEKANIQFAEHLQSICRAKVLVQRNLFDRSYGAG